MAKKVVLVEGPSDEIIFERIVSDLHGKQPMECGIDVISMRGLSLRRCLELCASVDKKVAALRDNDGNSPEELSQAVQSWLKEGKREIFIGEVEHGETLEPQLIHQNGESSLRKILGIRVDADLATWMKREKTEGAIRIASTSEDVKPPEYMADAARFIYG